MNLKDKLAIVTGGARDIGRAVSVKLAKQGAKVVVNYYRSEEQAAETLEAIEAIGGEAIVVNTPGSTKGCVEQLDAVIDVLPHALRLLHDTETGH